MKYKGYVESFSYRNPENGYGIFTLIGEGVPEGEIKCTGQSGGLDVGDCLEIEGELIVHPTYGPQIKISAFRILPPEEDMNAERYLASGAIKGIGPVLAMRIVKKFGKDTFRVLDEEPERLAEISGISIRMAAEIGVRVLEKRELREAMLYLSDYGISNSLAVKIYNRYKAELYDVFQKNPYRLAEDIDGIGFKTADEIAEKSGISKNSPQRIRGGLFYILSQNVQEGNTYMPMEKLLESAEELLEITREEAKEELIPLIMEQKIVVKGDNQVFLASLYMAELNIAAKIKALKGAFSELPLSAGEKKRILTTLHQIKEEEEMFLDDVQTEAVLRAAEQGIFILTGGPGTGKTTTLRAIIRYFDLQGQTVFLCAPTGRAAKRMEEATGYVSKTIHRLLEVSGGGEGEEDRAYFHRNESNPLEADVIVVDEMSMVDTLLFKALLSAIPEGCRLILSGDAAQLPSVGPGNVLKDLIRSGFIQSLTLEKIYRQAEGGEIAAGADCIRRGIMPDLAGTNDFFFVPRQQAESIYRDMVLLIKDRIPAKFNVQPLQIQVLTPMKAGNFGVLTLNKILQESLNPPSEKKGELVRGETVFRLGDKVMQHKNNYNVKWHVRGIFGISGDEGEGIFNGDTGIITDVDIRERTLTVTFDDDREVEYDREMLEELELAYAVTIHKSQGSEYPGVILPLVDGPKMLMNRNLLYTALTRGTGCVMILGKEETIRRMVETDGEQKRFTGLYDRLCEVLSE